MFLAPACETFTVFKLFSAFAVKDIVEYTAAKKAAVTDERFDDAIEYKAKISAVMETVTEIEEVRDYWFLSPVEHGQIQE